MKALAAEAQVATLADYFALTKPRITALVVATTLVGFYLASHFAMDPLLLFHTLLGTALVASGASALNMVLEWELDAKMRRTESRPIPAGKISVLQAMAFGSACSLFGIFYLWILVNWLTSVLALITLILYLCAYTPLKRKTWLCTLVGAVPGAIPPMMGWTAASGSLQPMSFWLFAILFFWQLPHFFSIAWIYREDYARGGFCMLTVVDESGTNTSRQIVLETAALVLITLIPVASGMFYSVYMWGALLLGLTFLLAGIWLAKQRTTAAARRVLLASVAYLPLLLILMMITRIG